MMASSHEHKSTTRTKRQLPRSSRDIEHQQANSSGTSSTKKNTKKNSATNGDSLKHARPYRSHRYPACARCHKRKSKCTIEVPGEPCLQCRLSKSACSASAHNNVSNSTGVGFVNQSSTLTNVDMDGYAQVLGPVLSRDTQVLETIVSDIHSNNQRPLQANNIPIYRSGMVPRRPSPPSHWSSQELTTQLFQQIDPHIDQLVALYFEELHPCLPMMDEREIWKQLKHQGGLHSLFLTNLIAYTSFYWDLSSTLPPKAKPDQDFVWDVAVLSIKDQSQKSGIFAITAAALNVAGRPSKGAISNTCQIARITALSHSIGLNHNCMGWNLTQPEKYVRTKLWWVIVVHDRWFHFAQGTPPYISNQHYNVSLPTLPMLTEGREASLKHRRAAECFILLCKLTEIVGDILPLIYHMRSDNDELEAQQIAVAEMQVDEWLNEKASWMCFDPMVERPFVPGFANLQLSYLVARMLLKRIAWHETSAQSRPADPSRLFECLTSAEAVSVFLSSLREQELSGFWLPYHAQHFTSAVTLLLRCALQMDNAHLRGRAMSSACGLVDRLKACHARYHWDLAEIVLPQTEAILLKIRNAVPKVYLEPNLSSALEQASSTTALPSAQSTTDGAADDDGFDFHDAALEDMFPEIFAEFTNNAFLDLQSQICN